MEKVNFEDITYEVNFDDEGVAEPIIEEEVEETAPPVAPKPVKSDPRIDKYNRIYDALLFEGKYEETYKLGKSYTAVLNTRDTNEDNIISRKLDAMKFQTVAAFNNMAAIFTLSYSLAEYNGKDFRNLTTTQRYDAILALPSPVIELLSNKMVEFDTMVREAMNYGSENF